MHSRILAQNACCCSEPDYGSIPRYSLNSCGYRDDVIPSERTVDGNLTNQGQYFDTLYMGAKIRILTGIGMISFQRKLWDDPVGKAAIT